MALVEQVHKPGIAPLNHGHFERLHEAADSQPEIVAHHYHALQPGTIALPQRAHQVRFHIVAMGMQPLLELVDHHHHAA